jgi:hypothetical protein
MIATRRNPGLGDAVQRRLLEQAGSPTQALREIPALYRAAMEAFNSTLVPLLAVIAAAGVPAATVALIQRDAEQARLSVDLARREVEAAYTFSHDRPGWLYYIEAPFSDYLAGRFNDDQINRLFHAFQLRHVGYNIALRLASLRAAAAGAPRTIASIVTRYSTATGLTIEQARQMYARMASGQPVAAPAQPASAGGVPVAASAGGGSGGSVGLLAALLPLLLLMG